MVSPPEVFSKNNVLVHGNPDADRTLLFTHGFGTNRESWDAVASAFADRFRLVTYDTVGGGHADLAAFSPNKYDSLDTYASDLLDIFHATNNGTPVTLVGHSMGGMISLLATIKAPDVFEKLVMIGSSPRYRNDEGYTGGFEQSDLDALYEAMNHNYFAWISGFAALTMRNADRPQLAENFAASLSAIRPDIAQSVVRVIFQGDYRNRLPKASIPTLILQSTNDIAVPGFVADYMHEQIEGSQKKVVNAEGHFPHISAPAEIISALHDFI